MSGGKYRRGGYEFLSNTWGDRQEVDPVAIIDIADRLKVKPQTVSQWKHRRLLPEPQWIVGRDPAWDWAVIEAWARETGRLPE